MYQLCLGDESFPSLFDRIVARVRAIDDGIDRAACRRLVELVFRARVRKTIACGAYTACRPAEPVWGQGAPRPGETMEWADRDPEGVPAIFAAAVADLTDVAASRRPELERRIAAEMRAVLAELVFCNPQCGQAPICRAEPVFPLRSDRR